MQPDPAFGYPQIVAELLRGIIEAISDKPGIAPERRASIMQTAVCSIMAFNPRDPIETMLAGHCIVYDSLLRDGVRAMSGDAGGQAIRARASVLDCGKTFLASVAMLLRLQRRPAEQLAFAGTLPGQDAHSGAESGGPENTGDVPPVAASNEAETPIESDDPSSVAPAQMHARMRENVITPMSRRQSAPPAPARVTPQPDPDLGVPGIMSAEIANAMLFDGIEPALRQEILEAAALALQSAAR
jgi:hypothetical protein